jgi:hypothetical protein
MRWHTDWRLSMKLEWVMRGLSRETAYVGQTL